MTKIVLDVGGVTYHTTQSTLTSRDTPNYFDGLFSGSFAESTESNEPIFIDRDGELFRHVLQYLRTGFLGKCPDPDSLRIEADFFQLPGLAQLVDGLQAAGASGPAADLRPVDDYIHVRLFSYDSYSSGSIGTLHHSTFDIPPGLLLRAGAPYLPILVLSEFLTQHRPYGITPDVVHQIQSKTSRGAKLRQLQQLLPRLPADLDGFGHLLVRVAHCAVHDILMHAGWTVTMLQRDGRDCEVTFRRPCSSRCAGSGSAAVSAIPVGEMLPSYTETLQ